MAKPAASATVTCSGGLNVVGTGIRYAGQITTESRNLIANADRVFAVMADTLSLGWLTELNPRVTSLQHHYRRGRRRDESYRGMVDEVLQAVRQGQRVCAVFYGHPGVFVWPSHEMIRRARDEGYPARMFPAISAEDCLFADLGVDPARSGCQSYEAMDFLLFGRVVDPSAALILWQVAALGDYTRSQFRSDKRWLGVLVEVLRGWYPEDHPVTLYDAAVLPLDDTRMETIALAELATATLSPTVTLYAPPARPARLDPQRLRALGVSQSDLALSGYQEERLGQAPQGATRTGSPEP